MAKSNTETGSRQLPPLKVSGSFILSQNKVEPILDRRKQLTLRGTDIRRIAALRAKDRLNRFIMKQKEGLFKGRMLLKSRRDDSLLPLIDDTGVELIEEAWVYFLKRIDRQGALILAYLIEKDPRLVPLFPKLTAIYEEKGLAGLRTHPYTVQYGRSFILHVCEILTNIRNSAAMQDMLHRNFTLLREAGCTRHMLEDTRDHLEVYMKAYLPSVWTDDTAEAWKVITSSLIDIVSSSWKPDPTTTQKFQKKNVRFSHGITLKEF